MSTKRIQLSKNGQQQQEEEEEEEEEEVLLSSLRFSTVKKQTRSHTESKARSNPTLKPTPAERSWCSLWLHCEDQLHM
ncbi:hypothetical protein INR49_020341 [Caranx melampygus]|nr:hypothetical protein INR49_020341 [Caranx melampygus]